MSAVESQSVVGGKEFFENIGEYADTDKYDLINNENWYCKFGYVPSTVYYVSLYGAGN